MTDSNNIQQNGNSKTQDIPDNEKPDVSQEETQGIVCAPEEKSVIPPPKLPETFQITKSGQFQIQTNLPPEIALATLPYISSDERKLLISEIGKENERMFAAFKIQVNLFEKDSIIDKIYYGFFALVFIALILFLALSGYETLLDKILTIALGAFGGGGVIIYRLHKKGKLSK